MKRIQTQTLVQYALFVGIILLMGLTPSLGYIPLPIADITIIHIPVIVGSYRFGIKGGALFGFFFGLTSLITCFIRPDAISAIVLGANTGFGLYNLLLIVLILFLPRILTGVFAALTYKAIKRISDSVAMAISAVAGSITNTVFVLGGLFLFAFEASGQAFGLSGNFTVGQFLSVLLSIVLFNGLLEAAAAALICTPIGKALSHFNTMRKKGA